MIATMTPKITAKAAIQHTYVTVNVEMNIKSNLSCSSMVSSKKNGGSAALKVNTHFLLHPCYTIIIKINTERLIGSLSFFVNFGLESPHQNQQGAGALYFSKIYIHHDWPTPN